MSIFTELEREKLQKAADKKPEPEKPSVATVGDRVQKRLKSLRPKTLGEGYGFCPNCAAPDGGPIHEDHHSRTRGRPYETTCGSCKTIFPNAVWESAQRERRRL